MDERTIVIVGAGLAGDTAAEALRQAKWDGRIVIVGDEPERPYDRPPLSKAVLMSAEEEAKTFFRAESWYGDNGIELLLNDAAVAIEADDKVVELASGTRIAFHKLLIATGASMRRLPMLETELAPVFYLRSLADARALRAALNPGAKIAIVGGGVIGLEVAASAVQRGCDVTVIEAGERIMARSISSRVSAYLADYHYGKGAKIVVGARITGISRDGAGARIDLADGSAVPVDAIVIGIGAQPNSGLAAAAGLTVDDGIVVDRWTRTSHPDIHAAGDVTKFESEEHGYARAEHWRHAIDQATIAARVMAGEDITYREAPWIWTDQYELNVQVTGAGQGDVDVLRGRIEDHAFTVFHLKGGRLIGATSINQGKFKRPIGKLVEARVEIDAATLADESVDLKKMAAALP